MKKILITHYDLDGVSSAIIMNQAIKFDKTFKGSYTRMDDFIGWVNPGDYVVVTDVCLTIEQFAALKKKAAKIIYIDHHPDSKLIKETFTEDIVIFDDNKAGAGLCMDFVQNKKQLTKPLRMLAKAANHYDLFERKTEPDWFKFGYDLNILFWEYHFDSFFERFKNGFDGFKPAEKLLVANYKAKRDKAIEESTYGELDGEITGLICVPTVNSIQNDIPYAKKGYDLYYIIMHYGKSVSISVRSPEHGKLDEYMAIAKTDPLVKSAGGHPAASGINFHGVPTNEALLDHINWLHTRINWTVQAHEDLPF